MDATAQALFEQVIADPEADAPRLVLADHLEARSDPRGNFIRLQMIAARGDTREERFRAHLAAEDILEKHRAEWQRDLEGRVDFAGFVRGFVELIFIDAAQFLRTAPEVYGLAPIRMLVLTNPAPVIRDLAHSVFLDRIVKLALSKGGLSDAQVVEFLASPHLKRLKAISLSFNDLGPSVLDALCRRDRLPSLISANVVGNRFVNPVEGFGEDWASGTVAPESVYLPELGKQLEAKHGPQPWLHAPTLLREYPPSDEDL